MTQSVIRQPLRRAARQLVLERLLSGSLAPGERINESRLSAEIGVSRTPLREALIRLEIEGFVENDNGRGFTVLPLDAGRARDLYTVMGLLESQALEASVPHGEVLLERLAAVEDRRAAAKRSHDFETAVGLDQQWHTLLVSRCSNEELLGIISMVKHRLYRYEYVLTRQREWQGRDHDNHTRIVEALREGNRPLAVEILKHHWQKGAEIRAAWLDQPDVASDSKWTSLM